MCRVLNMLCLCSKAVPVQALEQNRYCVVLACTAADAHSTQHPGYVLCESNLWVLTALEAFLGTVCQPPNIVIQQMAERVIHECIDSEVPLQHILLPYRGPRSAEGFRPQAVLQDSAMAALTY